MHMLDIFMKYNHGLKKQKQVLLCIFSIVINICFKKRRLGFPVDFCLHSVA